MKALDLTNQRFGNLIALQKAPNRKDKYTRWICQCDCGNIVEVRTDYLRSSHTNSCGCEKQKYFYRNNIIGKSFGKLTVLKFDEIKQLYLCKCECGNLSYVEGYNLMNKNTQSCGCLKSKGELKINNLLINMNINFKTQYSFNDCRFPDTNRLAYFDYAIFENNNLIGLIEYDGIQHEIGWNNNKESLNRIQAYDAYKNYYCLINNIKLFRISYTDLNLIDENYLNNIINKMKEEIK